MYDPCACEKLLTAATLSCSASTTSPKAQATMNLEEETMTVECSSKEPREDVGGVEVEKEKNVEILVHKSKGFLPMN